MTLRTVGELAEDCINRVHERSITGRHPPVYAPPYDSPIEDEFAQVLVKVLRDDVRLVPQFPVRTRWGDFRFDFMLEAADGQHRIAIECDGREFHDQSRDEWRDAATLLDAPVNAVWRFRGTDIVWRCEDCVYLFGQRATRYCDQRRVAMLESLISEATRRYRWQRGCRQWVEGIDPDDRRKHIEITRRRKVHLAGGDRFLSQIRPFMEAHPGPLDSVIELWRKGV